MNPRLLLLACCQALFLTNNITFIAINGLVGLSLAPVAWMATLPLVAYVGGAALCTRLAARHQRQWGRKRAFQFGLATAIAASLLCWQAVAHGQFWLFIAATVVAGYYSANAVLYRFAAIELVGPGEHSKAISWVLAAGLFGAVAGPALARTTRSLAGVPFVGAYQALAVVALVGLVLMSFLEFPPIERVPAGHRSRSALQLARQPGFLVAVLAAALGYGVMNLLMAATPIAMAQCGYPFGFAAGVLQWHVLGMFLPSFFTGSLIRRVGVRPLLVAGTLLYAACVGIGLGGTSLARFTGALVLLGVGWNFLYVGGTTLLVSTYEPHEKTHAQGTMDLVVYSTMAVTSFGSGALVTSSGWHWINLASAPLVAVLALAVGWLYRAGSEPATLGN